MASFAIMVHPLREDNADVAFVGESLPTTTRVTGNDHGVPAIGIQNKVYIVVESLVWTAPSMRVVSSAVPWAMHNSRFTKGSRSLPHGLL